MTPSAAKKMLKENGIKYVLAQFVDIHGAAKAKAVPVEHLDMILKDGAGFAGFAVWGLGMGPHGPDYMAARNALLDALETRGPAELVHLTAEVDLDPAAQPSFALGRHVRRESLAE